ncbi:MAG: flagellar basal body rod C-terminal domain-containing protein, partial [Alphaproteobacteria bacterium]
MTGYRVLDASGTPIFIPPDAGEVGIANDGTLSIGGRPTAQIGIFEVLDPQLLQREDGVMFRSDAEVLPAENSRVMQGFLEGSNVSAVTEMARLIEVQRAYELGQNLLDAEDKRIRNSIQKLGRSG